MTREQLFGVISVSISALTIWCYILFAVQPDKNDYLLMVTFFLAFVVWFGSLISTILYLIKVRRNNREVIYAHIKPSIRQGFLIASTLAILMVLQLLRVITVWDGFIVVIVTFVFEIAFQQKTPVRKDS